MRDSFLGFEKTTWAQKNVCETAILEDGNGLQSKKKWNPIKPSVSRFGFFLACSLARLLACSLARFLAYLLSFFDSRRPDTFQRIEATQQTTTSVLRVLVL